MADNSIFVPDRDIQCQFLAEMANLRNQIAHETAYGSAVIK